MEIDEGLKEISLYDVSSDEDELYITLRRHQDASQDIEKDED